MCCASNDLSSIRRNFHQCAELGFCEWETFDKIVSIVKSTSAKMQTLEPKFAEKALNIQPDVLFFKSKELKDAPLPFLKATFKLGQNGKNICFRCDLDALPIQESQDPSHLPQSLGFRAKRNMHACGHDGHIAIALSVLKRVEACKSHLENRGLASISFLFQSAEEGCKGAMLLQDSCLLKNIDDLYCFHLGMGLKTGFISPNPSRFLATLKFELSFTGLAAHAGRPSLGINALKPMCSIVNEALTMIDEEHSRLINFSDVLCPGAPNIIPSYCCCKGEIRSGTDDGLETMRQELLRLIKNSGAAANCESGDKHALKYDFKVTGKGSTIKQDQALVDKVAQSSRSLQLKLIDEFQFNASEDASLLIEKIRSRGGRGCYFCIGADIAAPHHNENFDFDEKALHNGYALLWEIIESYVKP